MSGSNGSPSFLPPHPKRGVGVRRLNKVPIWIFGGAAALALGATGYTYHLRAQAMLAQSAAETKRAEAGRATALDGAPTDGIILARMGAAKVNSDTIKPGGQTRASDTGTVPSEGSGKPAGEDEAAVKARQAAWQVYYAQVAELQRQRHDDATKAMQAGLGDGALSRDTGAAMQGNPTTGPGYQSGGQNGAQIADISLPQGPGGYPGGYSPYGYGGTPALPDTTGAREKQAFIGQRGSDGTNDTLIAMVRDPISPYLITAGDYITLEMQGGASSDTPGQMTARVKSDVYDSATGNHLLIPAFSKVIGTYDNVVSAGQDRLPAVLTRIIFPDSSSIPIGAMPAADQSGFAGLHDRVDRHLWEKFGNALIVAVAGAGIQLSQPQSRSNNNGYDSQQLIAGSLGQQFGALGQEVARAGLAIPNSVSIRPGYTFTIQVTKDIVLRPYVDGRTRGYGTQQVSFGPPVQ